MYVCSMYVVCMCMYVVFCKIHHCIHINWCIVMGLGHNDPWVESHIEGLEPKGPICIFGENEVLVSKWSFQHREPFFFMLTNTYNTSMAWYHPKMVGLSALCHNNLFRAKRSHLADRTVWTNQNQFHKALVSFRPTSICLVPKRSYLSSFCTPGMQF